jgi:uncharacterized protein (DUF4415 family)
MAGKSDFGIPDEENPELSAEDFARARPFKEVFPEQYKTWRKKMGRPPVERPKVHISFRLAADVVDSIRATGRGYSARVEKVLRDALEKGELDPDELKITERVLARFEKVETTERHRRGRPARTAQAVSLSDATLRAVQAHGEGATPSEVLSYLVREFGMTVRPNDLGNALQRHRRAGRLKNRDRHWFIPSPQGSA